jgi:hypothetical protein
MAYSIARCNSDGFFLMWGHVKEHVYAVTPRTVDDLVARLPAADAAVNAKTYYDVWKSAMRRTACCLAIDGNRFQHLL